MEERNQKSLLACAGRLAAVQGKVTRYHNQFPISSTVEQKDSTRKVAVKKKLIHQIKTHLDRDALKADLQQNQAYNPFSEKSKNMINSMGNVEYFEMCDVSPKIQCSCCLTCWTTGILYCRWIVQPRLRSQKCSHPDYLLAFLDVNLTATCSATSVAWPVQLGSIKYFTIKR